MTSSTSPHKQTLPTASASESQKLDAAEPVVPQITEKQARRINTPARNMVISMIVLVFLLLPVLWLMPQPDKNPYRPSVDLPVIAYEASQQAGYPVAAAEQEGWHYNYARWVTGQADGINYWSTGQVTASNHFIELVQAQDTNPTWIAQTVGQAVAEATIQAGGVSWEVRSLADADDQKKVTSFYIGEVAGTTVILKGQAETAEFQSLAETTVAYMDAPSSTVSPTPSSGIQ
ncbi:MAG: DUF4245 domain-containing protein [Rothia sp. (in: high G+C Gram-positive bacteria)]|nr:DUF4245 domain-containing protein [Rothia sp. (in: high G+C Gram-positive bacteria)]